MRIVPNTLRSRRVGEYQKVEKRKNKEQRNKRMNSKSNGKIFESNGQIFKINKSLHDSLPQRRRSENPMP